MSIQLLNAEIANLDTTIAGQKTDLDAAMATYRNAVQARDTVAVGAAWDTAGKMSGPLTKNVNQRRRMDEERLNLADLARQQAASGKPFPADW